MFVYAVVRAEGLQGVVTDFKEFTICWEISLVDGIESDNNGLAQEPEFGSVIKTKDASTGFDRTVGYDKINLE